MDVFTKLLTNRLGSERMSTFILTFLVRNSVFLKNASELPCNYAHIEWMWVALW